MAFSPKIADILLFATLVASGQTDKPKENPYTELSGDGLGKKTKVQELKPTPRTPDGKPDLSGFWQGPLIFGGMFKSVGDPPFTPAGEEAFKFNVTKSINPEGLCLFAGIPRASISGVPFEIVQTSETGRLSIRTHVDFPYHSPSMAATTPRTLSRRSSAMASANGMATRW